VETLKTNNVIGEYEMKTYEVELRRTSFIVLTVEAESASQAEELAWKGVNFDPVNDDASWDVESIEEIGGAK
jgi:hypothetical protein